MTETQQQLAQRLNQRMRRIGGGTDERVLAAMADHMPLFKQLLDTSTQAEMNALVQTYPAFGRYARVLERLAARLAAQKQRLR
jgi:ABC-type transporter Mla subunit MlaD